MKSFNKKYQLPSSFCRYEGLEPEYNLLKINRRFNWLKDVHLPFDERLINFIVETVGYKNTPFIIDGCNEAITYYLSDLGFESIRIGKEALLDLKEDHLEKKSLRELIRRGGRNNFISEVTFSKDNKDRLTSFIEESNHGEEPQLKHLFNNTFLPFNRLFVSKDANDAWYGAILFSYKEKDFAQTELMLRRKDAAVGVMEALIAHIFDQLKMEGVQFWSLGAVPFTIYNKSAFTKEGIINIIGRRLRFAYNFEGLYFFKDKFTPYWIDYYFNIRPRLNSLGLIDVLAKTNLIKLVLHKSLRLISRN